MKIIKVISPPLHDNVPDKINECWVGLKLPVMPFYKVNTFLTTTGAGREFDIGVSIKQVCKGYSVRLPTALLVLKEAGKEYAYSFLKKRYEGINLEFEIITFDIECCELIQNGKEVQTLASISQIS